MPKKMKRLEVSLTPIKKDIDKAVAALRSFKSKVSAGDKKEIDLQIKHLHKAMKEVRTACENKKMTPGYDVA